MLNSITSPLDGIRSPFGAIRNPFAAYNIGGQTPQTIAGFEADKYRANGTTSTAASLLTHTRAGTATYTDSTGTLQTAASGELRKDNHIWDGSSWVKRCLVEPQSTNLVTYSEDFTDASWNKLAGLAAMSSPTETGVDGNTSASVFLRANTSSTGLLYRVETIISGSNYTVSAYVKPDTHAFVAIALQGAASEHFATAVFDIGSANTGASETDVGTTSGTIVNTNQEVASNGFYRISITCSVAQTTAYPWIGFAAAATGNTFSNTGQVLGTWDLSDAFIGGGFQLEASSVPTSYIPTAGSQVTRPADALSIDSTLLPYDSTAMTIAMAYNVTGDDGTLFNWEADANNKITASVASGTYTFTQIEAGTSDSVTGGTLADGTNTAASVASRHTDGDINAAIDGTALTVNSTVTALADLSASDFEIAPSTALNIKTIRLLGGYGATDAELEAAT